MSGWTWEAACEALPVGSMLKGGAYRVFLVDPKGASAVRVATGSTVRATRRATEAVYARLQAGERLLKQTSAPRGGISYTVAVEALVVALLAGHVAYDAAERVWVAA